MKSEKRKSIFYECERRGQMGKRQIKYPLPNPLRRRGSVATEKVRQKMNEQKTVRAARADGKKTNKRRRNDEQKTNNERTMNEQKTNNERRKDGDKVNLTQR